jgi:hypothetical protein
VAAANKIIMNVTKVKLKQLIREEFQIALRELFPTLGRAATAIAPKTKTALKAADKGLSAESAYVNAQDEDYIGTTLAAASVAPGPIGIAAAAGSTAYAIGKGLHKLNKEQQAIFANMNKKYAGKRSRNVQLQSWRKAQGLNPDGTSKNYGQKFPSREEQKKQFEKECAKKGGMPDYRNKKCLPSQKISKKQQDQILQYVLSQKE